MSLYNGRFEFSMPAEIRQNIYEKLNVRTIESVCPFGFLGSYIDMFLNVKDEMNRYSDFRDSFVFFLKEIRLVGKNSGDSVCFNDFVKWHAS